MVLINQLYQRRAIQTRAGHHHRGTDHRAGIGRAPSVDVEHGHNGQNHVFCGDRDAVGQVDAKAVQHGRAVRIQNALGVAGGTRGVAQARCGVLVQIGPDKLGVAAGDEIVIELDAGQLRGGLFVGAFHQNDMFEMLKLVLNACNQRHEGLVDEQHLIFGVVQDIDQLFGEQTRVDGVTDKATARCAKVDFKVATVVPSDGAATGLRVQTQIGQRRRKRTGITRNLPPRGLL